MRYRTWEDGWCHPFSRHYYLAKHSNVFFRAFQEQFLHHMYIYTFGHVLVSIFKQLVITTRSDLSLSHIKAKKNHKVLA